MDKMNVSPKIVQTKSITGRTVKLRNVTVEDAAFIVSLRTNAKKGRFISATSKDISEQQKWIQTYLCGQGQAYFMIEDLDGHTFGTVRMYDQKENSFCWGSWVISEDAPTQFAIESALLIYTYALELGFERAHFDVRKGNQSVIKFHERFGALRTGETDDDIFYSISKESILNALGKFTKFLPEKVIID